MIKMQGVLRKDDFPEAGTLGPDHELIPVDGPPRGSKLSPWDLPLPRTGQDPGVDGAPLGTPWPGC